MIMKETLQLNEEESASLNFYCDSCKVMQKYFNSSTILDFEENIQIKKLWTCIVKTHLTRNEKE